VSKLDANGGFDSNYMLIAYEYNGTEFVPKDESKTYYFEPGDLESVRFVAEYRTEGQLSTDANISYNDDEEITVEDQSMYRIFEDLTDTVTCSIRNPKITFQLKHINPKITLNFSSEVTVCKVAYKFSYISYLEDGGTKENVYTNIYLCYLTTSDGKTKAEAYVGALKPLDGLTIEATTKDGYKYTAKIELPVLVANTNYIYNVNLHEGLTVVNNGTTISDYSDDTSGTFTGEEVTSGSTI
jgi:hypothetical protein